MCSVFNERLAVATRFGLNKYHSCEQPLKGLMTLILVFFEVQ